MTVFYITCTTQGENDVSRQENKIGLQENLCPTFCHIKLVNFLMFNRSHFFDLGCFSDFYCKQGFADSQSTVKSQRTLRTEDPTLRFVKTM